MEKRAKYKTTIKRKSLKHSTNEEKADIENYLQMKEQHPVSARGNPCICETFPYCFTQQREIVEKGWSMLFHTFGPDVSEMLCAFWLSPFVWSTYLEETPIILFCKRLLQHESFHSRPYTSPTVCAYQNK